MNTYLNRIKGYNQAAPAYNNAVGAVSTAYGLNPNDRTLTFNIINSSTSAAATVRLFGASKDLTDATLPAGLTVNVLESSHLQVKTELLQNPFRILGLSMTVQNASQFTNTWSIKKGNSTGSLQVNTFQPMTYRSPQNNIETMIQAMQFELIVDMYVYIEFSVNASENITITFNQAERTNSTRLMTGEPVREVSTSNAPTGLPQIDLYAKDAVAVTNSAMNLAR